jgi:glycosyltransferase involved in cell wall biosynthesis
MISVVIPMYNSSGTILQSIRSVLDQSYEGEIEIIVVNDGSTDDSLNLVRNFCKNYQQLSIIIIDKKNGGVSSARNAGMQIAKGEFIALLDSDDEWNKNKLQEQMKVLSAHPEIDLLGCNRNNEVITSFIFKKFERLTYISSRLLLYKNFFSTPTVIFKRDVLKTVGFFDESQRFAEEGNYWIRICNKGTCMLLNESYVITGGGKPDFGYSGLSSNLLKMEKGELKNIKDALALKVINYVEFIILNIYSIAKYLRRVLIVKLR